MTPASAGGATSKRKTLTGASDEWTGLFGLISREYARRRRAMNRWKTGQTCSALANETSGGGAAGNAGGRQFRPAASNATRCESASSTRFFPCVSSSFVM